MRESGVVASLRVVAGVTFLPSERYCQLAHIAYINLCVCGTPGSEDKQGGHASNAGPYTILGFWQLKKRSHSIFNEQLAITDVSRKHGI